jgi:hypothetical protein
MKNFTITLGIGLTQLIMEYWVVAEPSCKHQSHYYEPKRGRGK